ncbi:hypothetical protein GGX14DRAFT_393825 [Mycena pura]|uniref:Uncharacterized protein n=1 Tax=Mycena pura TaxID=153505 RepID=A0AAD6VGE3_9AGAR|nr:hypothetical protein GGX14DRAFT_393825 [Mycena pura]
MTSNLEIDVLAQQDVGPGQGIDNHGSIACMGRDTTCNTAIYGAPYSLIILVAENSSPAWRWKIPTADIVMEGIVRFVIALAAVLIPGIWEVSTTATAIATGARVTLITFVFFVKIQWLHDGDLVFSVFGILALPVLFIAPYLGNTYPTSLSTPTTVTPSTLDIVIFIAKLGGFILAIPFLSFVSYSVAATYRSNISDLGRSGIIITWFQECTQQQNVNQAAITTQ